MVERKRVTFDADHVLFGTDPILMVYATTYPPVYLSMVDDSDVYSLTDESTIYSIDNAN